VYSNTAWTVSLQLNSIIVPPYDIDGNLASFSPTELSNIVAIWRGVSEDYAPFNVDVTTVNEIATGAPMTDYVRVAIGGKSSIV
jgi:hypothetical protein